MSNQHLQYWENCERWIQINQLPTYSITQSGYFLPFPAAAFLAAFNGSSLQGLRNGFTCFALALCSRCTALAPRSPLFLTFTSRSFLRGLQ
ncbi:MAG TPA: hypothetical protein VN679_09480, partial [Candidatus Acidoferrales bacterium]|nr:hypothetical protein [Candidatus Acidoferrales bacterium]